ncbi:MAG: hypothetical protein GY695_25485, partial [Aestuariibacter sp.]|nr:hypothetical protein [Aestuariibacter sp.]
MQINVRRIGLIDTEQFADELHNNDVNSADLNIAFGDVNAITALSDAVSDKANWIASSSCLGAMSHLGTDLGDSYVHVMSLQNTQGAIGVASCDISN